MPIPADETEALVRVLLSGICNTDIEIMKGYAGFEGTLGHEFVGIVEESPGRPELVGKRVVGEINAGCGQCSVCSARDPRHCISRTVFGIVGRDGAHAEFLQLPSDNLFDLPDSICDEEAVFVEPLAAAFGISEQVTVGRETNVAVIGDGKLGLLCAMSIAQFSQNVTLVGKHRSKLKIAKDHATGVLLEDLNSSTSGYFDVAIEASGSGTGFETAIDLVKPRGKIVLKSTYQGTPTWSASKIVVNEISVIGSRCGRFEPAIDLLRSNKINLSEMIDSQMRLADGVEAMEKASKKGTLKILLSP
jgi:threonine dehydrogenase-like Zn-dependent dehydrogenase